MTLYMPDQNIPHTQKPKVTVYIPSYNYARYLEKAVESIHSQIYSNWELIIIDDGSTDETIEIAQKLKALYPADTKVIRNDKPLGLFKCANIALKIARGEYFMRLDADDYLDESALLVMATYLNNNPDIALVYPNYTYVDQNGAFLHTENRKKIGEEDILLDQPAHGACTMVRKRVLKTVGGYTESNDAQDGYELWLKISTRYQIANVTTPLFFYRQHANSLSRDSTKLLKSRRRIKRQQVARDTGSVSPRIVFIVPAVFMYVHAYLVPSQMTEEAAGAAKHVSP